MICFAVYLLHVSKVLNMHSKSIRAFWPLLSFHVHRRASYVAYRVGGRLPACINGDIDTGGEVRFTNERTGSPPQFVVPLVSTSCGFAVKGMFRILYLSCRQLKLENI